MSMLSSLIPHKYAQRDSSIELLRILAMLSLILVHVPSALETTEIPGDSYFTAWLNNEILAILKCNVNVFIIISGYYGIKPSFKGFFNLLFIKYFWGFAIMALAIALYAEPVSVSYIVDTLNPLGRNWFISAYFGLMFLSIFINKLVDNSSER